MLTRTTTRFARLAWMAAWIALALAACGGDEPLELTISASDDVAALDDITRLQVRVFTIEDATVDRAQAIDADGQVVEAVSCETLADFAPEASDCTEETVSVLQDADRLHSGRVPASGVITIERPNTRVRVYVEVPGDQLRIDASGRVCRWSGVTIVEPDVAAAEVVAQAIC